MQGPFVDVPTTRCRHHRGPREGIHGEQHALTKTLETQEPLVHSSHSKRHVVRNLLGLRQQSQPMHTMPRTHYLIGNLGFVPRCLRDGVVIDIELSANFSSACARHQPVTYPVGLRVRLRGMTPLESTVSDLIRPSAGHEDNLKGTYS